MGIPFYFKKLSKDFNHIVIENIQNTPTRLFLDYNGGIHKCSNDIKSELIDANKTVNNSVFENMLIERCIDYIKTLIQVVKPTQMLYIAIDGIAPMAKIAQQRKRRYFSDWRKRYLLNLLDAKTQEYKVLKNEWNSNAITPGTNFMNTLMTKLEQFVKEFKLSENIDVVLSASNTFPGEGEHKIFQYIKNNDYDDNTIDIIYGLDADLILLSMLSKNYRNTFLLRENTKHFNHTEKNQQSSFVFMDIKHTKNQVVQQFKSIINDTKSHQDHILKCYVFLTFLLGNDFVPNLSHLSLRKDGLDILIDIYDKTYNMFNQMQHILHEDDSLNIQFFHTFLEELSLTEDTLFANAETEYYNKQPSHIANVLNSNKHNTLAFENKKLDFYGVFHKYPKVINPHQSGWRKNYYYYLFHNNPSTTDIIQQVCVNYLTGLQWICNYYFKQNTNWIWYYKFNYSPTIVDLTNMLSNNMHMKNDSMLQLDSHTLPVGAVEQMLMVLPESSKSLIPIEKYRIMYNDASLGKIHMFPTNFKIVSYMKCMMHECHGDGLCITQPLKL